jgi:pimeloyl-ACP methyl ester carboxylesterase
VALLAAADAAGFDRFHLAGYSAGASVAAMVAVANPARVATLTLIEPPWLGNSGRSGRELDAMNRIGAALSGPPQQAMAAFTEQMLRPGAAPPPPPGPEPDWMDARPAGIRAIGEAFATGDLSPAQLAGLPMPVLLAICGDSNPDLFGAMADRMSGLIPRLVRKDFPGLSHLNPPQKAIPMEFAAGLEAHWAAADD